MLTFLLRVPLIRNRPFRETTTIPNLLSFREKDFLFIENSVIGERIKIIFKVTEMT